MIKSACSKKKEIELATQKLVNARISTPKEVTSFFNKRVKNSIGKGRVYGEYIQEYKGRMLRRMFAFVCGEGNPYYCEYLRQYEDGKQITCSFESRYAGMGTVYAPVLSETNHKSGWCPRWTHIETRKQNLFCIRNCFQLNEKEAIEKFGKYCGYKDVKGREFNSLFEYLCYYHKNSGIEYLAKNGFVHYIKHLNVLNLKGKNFGEIFGVDKKYAEVLKKNHYQTLAFIKQHAWAKPNDVEALERAVKATRDYWDIKPDGKQGYCHEILYPFDEKQWKYLLKQQDKLSYRNLHLYKDYLKFAEQLAYPLEESKYRYPTNLKQAHDDAEQKIEIIKNKENNENIMKYYLENKKYSWKPRKYSMQIFPCKTSEELLNESKQQHNCVRTYIPKVADGQTEIFFIRKNDSLDSSFVTLELKNGNYIEQVFAQNNTRVDEETEQFVLDWKKKFRFKGWKGYAY